MKKTLKKVILTCAAAAALMGLMSVSAMAAEYVQPEEGSDQTYATVTLDATVKAEGIPGMVADKQATVVVVKGDNPTTINEADIEYIGQETFATLDALTGTIKLPADLAQGTYTVKMGGEGATKILVDTFTVGGGVTPPTPGGIDFGNVNNDDGITAADAFLICKYEVGLTESSNPLFGTDTYKNDDEKKAVADINGDNDITAADAFLICKFEVSLAESSNALFTKYPNGYTKTTAE